MLRQNKKDLISVIIPAFKQEKTIGADLRRIKNVLEQLNYEYEIIVVVDGTTDKTLENAKKVSSKKIKVLGYEKNKGKGYAVRYGMVRAKGTIIGFLDAGMELNPNGLAILLEKFQELDADVIIGSKRHKLSKVHYPFVRRATSVASQILIRALFGLSVRDTQVGMKFFKKKVIEDVLPRLLVKKFAFDIEILVVAYYLGYKKIYDAPVELTFDFEGSLVSKNLAKAIFNTLWDTLAIFYRLKILHYYSDGNRRRWRLDSDLNFPVNLP